MKPTRPESLICPRCRNLISGYLDECSHCGLSNPSQKARGSGLLSLGSSSMVKPILGLCIGLLGLSYLLPLFLPGLAVSSGSGFFGFLPAPSSISLAMLGWADPRAVFGGHWYLLVTAIFLHGGILHLVFNLLWVRDLGLQAEALLGGPVMLLVFVLTGMGGNLLAVGWPLIASALGYSVRLSPVVGASGAIFGLMGVLMSYAPRGAGSLGVGLARQMGKWALVLILLGFLLPGVSNLAHIGGFISGWLIGKLIPLSRGQRLVETAGLFALALVLYSFAAQFLWVSDWLKGA